MNVGDRVKFIDCSFSMILTGAGDLVGGYYDARLKEVSRSNSSRYEAILIAKDCENLPFDEKENDCVIFSVEHQIVIFTCWRFLKPLTHTITIDGRNIEISDESYKNLKEQLK